MVDIDIMLLLCLVYGLSITDMASRELAQLDRHVFVAFEREMPSLIIIIKNIFLYRVGSVT